MRSRTLLAGAALVWCWAAWPAAASDFYWTGNLSGNWADGGNWQGGSPPSAADCAIYGSGNYANQPVIVAVTRAADKGAFFLHQGEMTHSGGSVSAHVRECVMAKKNPSAYTHIRTHAPTNSFAGLALTANTASGTFPRLVRAIKH